MFNISVSISSHYSTLRWNELKTSFMEAKTVARSLVRLIARSLAPEGNHAVTMLQSILLKIASWARLDDIREQ